MELTRRLLIFILLKLMKEVDEMPTIYATLIVKGYKTFDQVPATIKPQVADVLRQLEAEHLIIEEPVEEVVSP